MTKQSRQRPHDKPCRDLAGTLPEDVPTTGVRATPQTTTQTPPTSIPHLIQLAGGPTTLAKRLNLSTPAIASWSANKRIPYQHLSHFFQFADPLLIFKLNEEAPTQTHRGASRDLTLLKALAEGERNPPIDFASIAAQFSTSERLLKVLATKNHNRLNRLYETLVSLDRPFATSEELTEAKTAAAQSLNIQLHEFNRQLRKYGIANPEPASVAERKRVAVQRKEKQERTAAVVAAYISGSLSAEEAAEAGATSEDYLFRLARKCMDALGESPRSLRGFPKHIRTMLAEDVYAMMRGTTDTFYSPSVMRAYYKRGKTRRCDTVDAKRSTYESLLPFVVLGDPSVEDVALAKETALKEVKGRFTELLSRHGITWDAVEKMGAAHRDALGECLLWV